MLFQSLGSDYSYSEAWRHFLTIGMSKDRRELAKYLKERYGGYDVEFYYKGRSALTAAIGKIARTGDKVAVNGLTCYSVVQAVEAAGCEVVYIDVAENSLNFEAKQLKECLDQHPEIKVIIIQNTLGYSCDIQAIESLAHTNSLSIIEDLAHAAGAHYEDGREVGTVGDVTMLSFGREKAVDAANGGAVVDRRNLMVSDKITQRQPSMFAQLRDRWYPLLAWHVRALMPIKIGSIMLRLAYAAKLAVRSADGDVDISMTLPAWYCKRALVGFRRLDSKIIHRQKISARYEAGLYKEATAPTSINQKGASSLRFPLFSDNKKRLFHAFRLQGFHLEDIWYDTPVSPLRLAHKVSFPSQECPNTVKVSQRIINLPTHAGVTLQNGALLVKLIRENA